LKKALIVWGGLELHEPEAGAHIVRGLLEKSGFAVEVSGDAEALGRADIASFDLVAPQVTGGELSRDASIALCAAVEAGTGLAGFHHALATSFPGNARFRFLAGCTFATHPGDIISYRVDPLRTDDPVMAGIGSFEHTSEQYFMHVDPSVEVLATTTFSGDHASWKKGVKMPVVYKSAYGAGRVFYTALGHKPAELEKAEIITILERGLLWAAR
jgi:type 1 glutamine amidotransferase